MKILTLSLSLGKDKHGAWSERKDLFAAFLNKHQPDVVALQIAATDSAAENGKSVAIQLAESLTGYAAHVESVDDLQNLAFLSRLPFVETNKLKLTRRELSEDKLERILLHAAFDTEFGRLNLYNAHFSPDAAQCLNNVSETLEFADKFAGEKVLAGNLNQEPDNRAMRKLVETGWTDAFAKLSDESGFTFEAPKPTVRIDYVWAHGALADVLQSVILVQNPTTEIVLSNHVGLLITLFENPKDKAKENG